MYQVKAQGGYEIQVIGSGDSGLCRIEKATSSNNEVKFSGTYAECLKWLADRGIGLLETAK